MACVIFDETEEEKTPELIINGVPIVDDFNYTIQEEQVKTKINYSPGMVLDSLTYSMKNKNFHALLDYDYIITYSWDKYDSNWYGAISAWYDVFELWNITSYNTLPSELGGKKIALLFPDCPSRATIYQILLAILSKYDLDEKMFKRFCQSIYFIHKPENFILTKGVIPYEKYSPSNLIFVDGKIPKDVSIVCDNIYLSIIDTLKEESLKKCKYNFLFVYMDKRIFDLSKDVKLYPAVREVTIARAEYPNTLIFDDIRRIDFSSFKKPENTLQKKNEYNIEEPKKKRILLYMTERNKRHQIKEDSNNWTDHELDDILNSISQTYMNQLAIDIKNFQKELYDFYRESKKLNKEKLEFSDEQLIAIKEKGTIFGNGFTIDDVISQSAKVHFIIVGLTDKNRNFETELIRRAMERGLNISTEVYLQKELPIIDIHSKYDIYLFTPMYKWCTSRFISEALFYKKGILLTKEAKNTLKWNIPLNIRYHDSVKYLMFLAEDDVFKRPKSLIAKHILGNW
jgi:hypothetical protein